VKLNLKIKTISLVNSVLSIYFSHFDTSRLLNYSNSKKLIRDYIIIRTWIIYVMISGKGLMLIKDKTLFFGPALRGLEHYIHYIELLKMFI